MTVPASNALFTADLPRSVEAKISQGFSGLFTTHCGDREHRARDEPADQPLAQQPTSSKIVTELVDLGLVDLQEQDGKKVFLGPDLEVLAAIGQLEKLGFNLRTGFRPQDLLIYKRAREKLIEQELETFLRVVPGKASPRGQRSWRETPPRAAPRCWWRFGRLIVQMLATAGAGSVTRLLTGAEP